MVNISMEQKLCPMCGSKMYSQNRCIFGEPVVAWFCRCGCVMSSKYNKKIEAERALKERSDDNT